MSYVAEKRQKNFRVPPELLTSYQAAVDALKDAGLDIRDANEPIRAAVLAFVRADPPEQLEWVATYRQFNADLVRKRLIAGPPAATPDEMLDEVAAQERQLEAERNRQKRG